MSDVFNPQSGTDVAQNLGYSGMGPVANANDYGKMLSAQQSYDKNPFVSLGNLLGDFRASRAQTPQQQQQQMNQYVPMPSLQLLQPQRPQVQLQQSNLMEFLNMLGGR